MNIKKYKAFSLIELSVVILIIGLLSAGVLQGASVIQKARIANARTLTSKSPVTHIGGLVAWYETTLIKSFNQSEAHQDSQLTAWNDVNPRSQVTNSNILTRTADSKVTYEADGINKLPSVYFSTTTGNFTLPSFQQGPLERSTIFTVFSGHSTHFYNNMSFVYSYDGNSGITIGSDRMYWLLDNGSSYHYWKTLDGYENYIMVTYLNDQASKAYLNEAVTSSPAQTSSAGTDPLDGLAVGLKVAHCCGFKGYISEIIVYDRPLKIHERKKVMKYLSLKYGIAVAGDN